MIKGNKKVTIQFMNTCMNHYGKSIEHESRLTLYKLALVIYKYEQKRAIEYTWLSPDIFISVAEACQYATLAKLEGIATDKITVEYDNFRYFEKPIPQGSIARAKEIWKEWLAYRSKF